MLAAPRRGEHGGGLLSLLAALALVALLVALYLNGGSLRPPAVRQDAETQADTQRAPLEQRDWSSAQACAANRSAIRHALAVQRTAGDTAEPELLRTARCPSGGTYEIDDDRVTCTVHGG